MWRSIYRNPCSSATFVDAHHVRPGAYTGPPPAQSRSADGHPLTRFVAEDFGFHFDTPATDVVAVRVRAVVNGASGEGSSILLAAGDSATGGGLWLGCRVSDGRISEIWTLPGRTLNARIGDETIRVPVQLTSAVAESTYYFGGPVRLRIKTLDGTPIHSGVYPPPWSPNLTSEIKAVLARGVTDPGWVNVSYLAAEVIDLASISTQLCSAFPALCELPDLDVECHQEATGAAIDRFRWASGQLEKLLGEPAVVERVAAALAEGDLNKAARILRDALAETAASDAPLPPECLSEALAAAYAADPRFAEINAHWPSTYESA